MADHARFRLALGRGHVPALRRGANQQLARHGPALPDILVGLADALAAAGRKIAPRPVARQVLTGCRILRLLPCPSRNRAPQLRAGRRRRGAGRAGTTGPPGGALGLAGILAMRPFFREVEQEGVNAFYAVLAEALGPEALLLLLYHILRLRRARSPSRRSNDVFPDRIRGIKDSGADSAHTEALLAAGRQPGCCSGGSRTDPPDAMPAGAKGTICGGGNLGPGAGP